MDPEEQELLNDYRYRNYSSVIEKALRNFESSSEWADLISSLGKLNKVCGHRVSGLCRVGDTAVFIISRHCVFIIITLHADYNKQKMQIRKTTHNSVTQSYTVHLSVYVPPSSFFFS